MNNKYAYAGFTLAELLAVVIIVALLSSLSLGYYKRSVEQSRFSEGLTAASAVVEAVNQSYFDQQINGVTSPVTRPKIKTLDIELANQGGCASANDYCISTPRFEIQVRSGGVVRAYRGSTSAYKYYIEIQPNFATSNPDQIFCKGKDTNGNNFCQAMGYTQSGTNGYTRPAGM